MAAPFARPAAARYASAVSTVLITGANRGIGLGFARAYAADGWRVIAACRNPAGATALSDIGGDVSVHPLDVTRTDQVAALAAELEPEAIDILINNAGVGYAGDRRDGADADGWLPVFDVNTVGPVRMIDAFRGHVARSQHRVIASISSGLGSIGDNTSGGWAAYRASKAALNMVMRTFSVALASDGICCLALSPGWVRTDMGGSGATLAPEESVRRMRRILDAAGPAQSGRFYHHTGEEFPW